MRALLVCSVVFMAASTLSCAAVGQRRVSELSSQLDSANEAKLKMETMLADAQLKLSTEQGDKTALQAEVEALSKKGSALQEYIEKKEKEFESASELAQREQESNKMTWGAILAIAAGGLQALGSAGRAAAIRGAV